MLCCRLINHTGSVVFTCRVIHSLRLMQSVIHIFYQDKMAAVAHLVGSDTLPLPTQVGHRLVDFFFLFFSLFLSLSISTLSLSLSLSVSLSLSLSVSVSLSLSPSLPPHSVSLSPLLPLFVSVVLVCFFNSLLYQDFLSWQIHACVPWRFSCDSHTIHSY